MDADYVGVSGGRFGLGVASPDDHESPAVACQDWLAADDKGIVFVIVPRH